MMTNAFDAFLSRLNPLEFWSLLLAVGAVLFVLFGLLEGLALYAIKQRRAGNVRRERARIVEEQADAAFLERGADENRARWANYAKYPEQSDTTVLMSERKRP